METEKTTQHALKSASLHNVEVGHYTEEKEEEEEVEVTLK